MFLTLVPDRQKRPRNRHIAMASDMLLVSLSCSSVPRVQDWGQYCSLARLRHYMFLGAGCRLSCRGSSSRIDGQPTAGRAESSPTQGTIPYPGFITCMSDVQRTWKLTPKVRHQLSILGDCPWVWVISEDVMYMPYCLGGSLVRVSLAGQNSLRAFQVFHIGVIHTQNRCEMNWLKDW